MASPVSKDPREKYMDALERERLALAALMKAERELGNRMREYRTLREHRIKAESDAMAAATEQLAGRLSDTNTTPEEGT